jgi:hypothetical protein
MNPINTLLSLFIVFSKYYYGDEIKEDEMGGSCRTHGRDEKLTPSLSEILNGRDPLERFRGRWKENIKIDLETNRIRGCGLD